MNDIIQTFRDFEVIRDDDNLQHQVVEGIKPDFVPMSAIPKLDDALADRLQSNGITRLYKHQAEAISLAMAGKNVVLEAPTASGKTLAYAVPVLQSLLTSERGHALLVYPMKAVAADQRKRINQLLAGLTNTRGAALASQTYDGDQKQDRRNTIRKDLPSILMTNIEFLHMSFLGRNELWGDFLNDLRWVVVDEMHEYRGYFGTNVAMVFRRLVHHLRARDFNPQFFLASATCANPAEHANNLTSRHFELIQSGNDLRPKRSYIFIDPKFGVDPKFEVNESERELELRAARVTCALKQLGKSAIIFCPSRKFAEAAFQLTLTEFEERNRDKELIRIYKSGMPAKVRQTILQDLESGRAKYVFTTNALEVGIDIASLDAVVMVGFPDNVMSARQQIGRAGRDLSSEGLVVYLASESRHDKFFARRLPEFLCMRPNTLATDLGNLTVADDHAKCIWYETGEPGPAHSLRHLGEGIVARIAEIKSRSGKPSGLGIGGHKPHFGMKLRASGGQSCDLVHDGDVVGSISQHERFRDAFPGAIYLHGGVRYRVNESSVKSHRKVVKLERESADNRTVTQTRSSIEARDIFGVNELVDGSNVFSCDANVHSRITNVREVSNVSGDLVKRWHLSEDHQSFNRTGHAAGLQVAPPEVDREALRALEQIFCIGVNVELPVDRHDFFTWAEPRRNEVYIVEAHPGGIGIASRVFEQWMEILRKGVNVAASCACNDARGCFHCIVPPRRHDAMNKADGIALAQRLLDLASGASAPAPFAGPASSPHQSVDG